MRLLDLFSRKAAAPVDPDQLLERLLDTAARNPGALTGLCRQHRETILAQFPAWRKVPAEYRTDRERMERFANGIIAVAQVFAAHLSEPGPMELLTGGSAGNAMQQWEERLRQARALMEEARYEDAREVLEPTLAEARATEGTGADHYLALTEGFVGTCLLEGGSPREALPHLEEALALCEKQPDVEGILTYLGSLCELHRYLGHPEEAAAYADRAAACAEEQGRQPDAARYREQARRARAGEPLSRVVVQIDDHRCELDEVPVPVEGSVQFVFERNRPSLNRCTMLTQRASELGSAGRYEEALELFRQAARVDPLDPQPRYEEGLTLLCLSRYEEASQAYEATERLAPGWFHCRSDLWLSRKLAAGRLDQCTFELLRILEDGPIEPLEKVRLATQALEEHSDLPLLHLSLGTSLAALGRNQEAETALRSGLNCDPEPDVETRLLVQLGTIVQSPDEKQALLRRAIERNGNLTAAAMAAVILRNSVG